MRERGGEREGGKEGRREGGREGEGEGERGRCYGNLKTTTGIDIIHPSKSSATK